MKMKAMLLVLWMTVAAAHGDTPASQPAGLALQTKYARLQIDSTGFITSLTSVNSGKQYSPTGHPSPLLSLHEGDKPNEQLLSPTSATFQADKGEVELKYPNGSVAVVKVAAKETYFRFQLISLNPRGSVDNIVWGPLHTNISKIIGDLLGVVRDDDWAIGLYGLDDNTIAGPPVDGDCYTMGYIIHSPDKVRYPVPPQFKEGQHFGLGGDGVNDGAFSSHSEEYFQYIGGTGAALEPEYGSTVAYHARDRRKPYHYLWALNGSFQPFRARHMVSDPIDVDYMGSGVALYACPDEQGLKTIEKIIVGEGLPHIMINGKWIRDPSTFGVTLNWDGPYDKCIEYAQALGVKDISRETGEFFPCRGNNWNAGTLPFSSRPPMSVGAFTAEAHQHGLSNGGLHTLCVFLQGGISNDVTPVPSVHLQTVCRTTLAKDISASDTDIVVTDPSFLGDRGTWTRGDEPGYLRIGGEMLQYDGITETAPYTLKNIKRGHASKAEAHKAGDELVKLMQNCYNGFVPDMTLLLDCADYYADLMFRNGMDAINFDGFESTVYQNQGYYGTRVFCRRLFDSYARLTNGQVPRVTASNVFTGSWEYMNACNVGGGDGMFNASTGRKANAGKDIGHTFGNSYFPATFGIQDWHSDWSLYDAENLQAKAVGWEATYALAAGQEVIERTGEKDAILNAFHIWQEARAAQVFTKSQKLQLQDPHFKFHLEKTGAESFALYPISEIRISDNADAEMKEVAIANANESQPLEFALRFANPVNGLELKLPDGTQIKVDRKIEVGQFVVCKGSHAFLTDNFRKKIADLAMTQAAVLPKGDSKLGLQILGGDKDAKAGFGLTVWTAGKGATLAAAPAAGS